MVSVVGGTLNGGYGLCHRLCVCYKVDMNRALQKRLRCCCIPAFLNRSCIVYFISAYVPQFSSMSLLSSHISLYSIYTLCCRTPLTHRRDSRSSCGPRAYGSLGLFEDGLRTSYGTLRDGWSMGSLTVILTLLAPFVTFSKRIHRTFVTVLT